jgi:hypothetical protein
MKTMNDTTVRIEKKDAICFLVRSFFESLEKTDGFINPTTKNIGESKNKTKDKYNIIYLELCDPASRPF